MAKNYISMKLDEFKQKFKSFLLHKKKVKALENYAACHCNVKRGWVQLLRECLNCGFLEPKEEEFLDHMINKTHLEIEYLTWCHRTKWLKSHMQELAGEMMQKNEQIMIDFSKLDRAPEGYMPLNMVARHKQQQMRI